MIITTVGQKKQKNDKYMRDFAANAVGIHGYFYETQKIRKLQVFVVVVVMIRFYEDEEREEFRIYQHDK